VREALLGGERHAYERRLKEARRSKGVPGHERLPAATHAAQDAGERRIDPEPRA
jgi:hypothetical protein